MIGQLVELSSYGRTLKCCAHLLGRVGLVVDEEWTAEKKTFWVEWVGLTDDEAYPRRFLNGGFHLANGFWNRRDLKIIKK